MARRTILVEPKRWNYCRGEAGPIKRQHQWIEVSRDLVKDEGFDKDWIVVERCSCGDEFVYIHNWDNLLRLEVIALDVLVVDLPLFGD